MSGVDLDQAAEALRRFAVNLFYGYGYNYYRLENRLREDDQRVRRIASDQLQRARKALSEAEARYRREKFPPPSRSQPFPPAEAQADARRLEQLAAAVSAVDGAIAQAPAPGDDFMTRRYRNEADTLKRLSEQDIQLVELAHVLSERVEGRGYAAMLGEADRIEAAIEAVRAKMTERQALLT